MLATSSNSNKDKIRANLSIVTEWEQFLEEATMPTATPLLAWLCMVSSHNNQNTLCQLVQDLSDPHPVVEFTVDETGQFQGQFRNRLSFFCCSQKAAKPGFNFDRTRFQWFRSVSKMAEFEVYKCQMWLQQRAMLLIR